MRNIYIVSALFFKWIFMDCSEIKRGPSPEKTVSATGSVPMREQLSARVSRACEKLAALPELEVRPFILKGDKIGDDSCS